MGNIWGTCDWLTAGTMSGRATEEALRWHMNHTAPGVTMANPQEIPYFVKMNGCNNCKVFKSYTSLTGTEYGQDHDLHAKCVHMGCDRYGHNILAPFITPLEYLRIGLNTGLRKQAVAKAKRVIARFSEFYDHKGRLKSWVGEALSKDKLSKS
jgi:hypothetical protein